MNQTKKQKHPAMLAAVKKVGGYTALARAINIHIPDDWEICTRQVVEHWTNKQPPDKWVKYIEAASGISRFYLRPDLFDPEETALALKRLRQLESGEVKTVSVKWEDI